MSEDRTIRSLDRALDLLSLVARSDGISLSELASQLGQPVATIHRLLASLESRAMLELGSDQAQWHIGPEAFRLGSAFLRRSNIIERSRPIMRELTNLTGETSNLGIEWEGNVLFVSQVESHQFIRAFFRPGSMSPLHASGIGKALLSAYDPARTRIAISQCGFEPFTEKTISSPEALLRELGDIRRQGYALDNEERARGMRCVAAPILNGYGETVAGVSVSGPVERFPDAHLETLGRHVAQAASDISALIGGATDPAIDAVGRKA